MLRFVEARPASRAHISRARASLPSHTLHCPVSRPHPARARAPRSCRVRPLRAGGAPRVTSGNVRFQAGAAHRARALPPPSPPRLRRMSGAGKRKVPDEPLVAPPSASRIAYPATVRGFEVGARLPTRARPPHLHLPPPGPPAPARPPARPLVLLTRAPSCWQPPPRPPPPAPVGLPCPLSPSRSSA